MKKTFSLFVAVAVTCMANAQQLYKTTIGKTLKIVKDKAMPANALQPARSNVQAKGTAAAFYSEHFDTGLPAGWTVGNFAGPTATWKWYPQGQVSQATYALPAIATTTGSMIYDSDSIGGGGVGTLVPQGWMKSAAISCTGHSNVALKFAEYFRSFNDSCFVDVSNNGVTYTRYAVSPNNSLYANDFVPNNPYAAFIDISSVAANQATVYLRFSYFGPAGGGYSWQIDDVNLSELDATDVAMHSSFLYNDGVGAYHSSIGNVPLSLVDSIAPFTKLDNQGYNAQAGFTVNAKIFENNIQVYNQTVTVASLPVSAVDSIVQLPYYTPTSVGSYIVAYSLNVTGNMNTYNIADTVTFTVTDSIWSQSIGNTTGADYVHKPVALGEMSNYVGTRFDVPLGATDTIKTVDVAFGSTTTAGSEVQVQIYKLDNPPTNGWVPTYITYTHTLTAAEISTVTTVVYAQIPIDATAGQAILTEGTWAAEVTPVNVPASNTVTVLYTNPNPATGYAGYFGQKDTSANDGSFTFGFQTQATGTAEIPMVRLGVGSVVVAAGSVWPGDVNYDHIVDNNDGLDLLLGFGNTGVVRPGATNIYTGQPCTDWGSFIVPTVDMKNADCDGNGIVGYSDTVAINANYGLTHPKGVHTAQPKASGLPDLYFDLTAITFNAGTTVHIPIKLGNATQPMNNILGLAAQIKVNGIALSNAPTVSDATSWMGTTGNLLNFTKGVNSNETDWAFGRINHTNVSGNGTIATLNVDIPINATGQVVFYFDNVKMIDNAGNVITGYNVLDDTATIVPSGVKNVVSPVHELAIVPNPSSTQSALQLYLDAATNLHITITDIVGRTVYEMAKDGKQGRQSFELPAAQLIPGIYTVKLSSEAWQGTEILKWIKN